MASSIVQPCHFKPEPKLKLSFTCRLGAARVLSWSPRAPDDARSRLALVGNPRHDGHAACQGAVHRTFIGNFNEPVSQGRIDASFDADQSFKAVDLSAVPIEGIAAILAMFHWHFAMRHADR
jgi:hypothetical protein